MVKKLTKSPAMEKLEKEKKLDEFAKKEEEVEALIPKKKGIEEKDFTRYGWFVLGLVLAIRVTHGVN